MLIFSHPLVAAARAWLWLTDPDGRGARWRERWAAEHGRPWPGNVPPIGAESTAARKEEARRIRELTPHEAMLEIGRGVRERAAMPPRADRPYGINPPPPYVRPPAPPGPPPIPRAPPRSPDWLDETRAREAAEQRIWAGIGMTPPRRMLSGVVVEPVQVGQAVRLDLRGDGVYEVRPLVAKRG